MISCIKIDDNTTYNPAVIVTDFFTSMLKDLADGGSPLRLFCFADSL